jgi:hypothetical protein
MCQRQSERNDPSAEWRVGERVELVWAEGSALVLADDEIAGEEDLKLVAEG